MPTMQRINSCLPFDSESEDAARCSTSIRLATLEPA